VRYLKGLGNSELFDVFDFELMHVLGAYSPPNRWAALSGYPPYFSDVQVWMAFHIDHSFQLELLSVQ
jgi:hypothetical protein